jgi:hypothetical protein
MLTFMNRSLSVISFVRSRVDRGQYRFTSGQVDAMVASRTWVRAVAVQRFPTDRLVPLQHGSCNVYVVRLVGWLSGR